MENSFDFFLPQAFKNIKTILSSPIKKAGSGARSAYGPKLPAPAVTHHPDLFSS